jgi:hypothetical protein
MAASFDTQILRFDDDLQVEARTVLSHTAEPQNAFEVAVILETLGHTDATARARGYEDLFDLARRLAETLEDVGIVHPSRRRDGEEEGPRPLSLSQAAGLFVGQSLPWLTALFVLLAVGTGFWSSTLFTRDQSAAMVLALSVGLVSSAVFTYPFARRATFYRLQGRMSLVAWSARWILGAGVVGSVALVGGVYLLLERVMVVDTPGDTRAFFEVGVAIALLQLAFAPLYTLRAFGWLAAATAAGVGVLLGGLSQVDHGIYTDPFVVIEVQLASIGAMVLVSVAGSWWILRRAEERVAPPRKWAVVRSTAPYSVYGAGFFLLVMIGGLAAGGIWRGTFHYVQDYNVVTGAALFVLLPLFCLTTVAGERLPPHVAALVRRLSVVEVPAAAAAVLSRFRRELTALVGTGVLSGAVLIGMSGLLSGSVSVAGLVWEHLALFVGALFAYVALSVGVLSSQMLIVLSRPVVPAAAVVAASAVTLGGAGLFSLGVSASAAAVLGLLIGTVLFAGLTWWATDRLLRRFDQVYYGAL